MTCLITIEGKQAGRCSQLGNRTLAGGREPAREIQITDPRVFADALPHPQKAERHVIVEARARKRIFLNALQVKEHNRQKGDEMCIAGTALGYHPGEQPDRTNDERQFHKADHAFGKDRAISEEGERPGSTGYRRLPYWPPYFSA